MFGFFTKKTKAELLQEKYEKLLKTAFELSKVNRTKSDKIYAEAHALMNEIEAASHSIKNK